MTPSKHLVYISNKHQDDDQEASGKNEGDGIVV